MEGNTLPNQNRLQSTKTNTKLQKNVTPIIDTTWTTVKNIKNNIYAAQKYLKETIQNTSKLRKQYLFKRTPAHDIQNKRHLPKP